MLTEGRNDQRDVKDVTSVARTERGSKSLVGKLRVLPVSAAQDQASQDSPRRFSWLVDDLVSLVLMAA